MRDSVRAVRVLRVYHGGRNSQHRARERALTDAGVDLTLVVPSDWPEAAVDSAPLVEVFPIAELSLRRAGNVNAHVYADRRGLRRLINDVHPDVLDIHEEPFSLAARQ